MYSNEPELKKIQRACLGVFENVVAICNRHDLSYFMSGGTLLGAVRHGGFIPWDNDIDLVMPREDYEKLIEIAKKELIEPYRLEHYSLCKDQDEINTHHIQVVDTSVKLLKQWTDKEKIIHPWIDIFPLDGMPDSKLGRLLHYCHYRFWLRCMQLSCFDDNVNVSRDRPFYERWAIAFLRFSKTGKSWDTKKLMEKMDRIATKYFYDHGTYICSFHGMYKKKEIMPREWFMEKIELSFEDKRFIAMSHYDNILKGYYGDYLIEVKTDSNHKMILMDTKE